MSAHVLLNLLNELGKREKMRGLPSILSLFFATSLINSIIQEHKYYTLFINLISVVKALCLCHYVCNVVSGLSILLHDGISLRDATSYNKVYTIFTLYSIIMENGQKCFNSSRYFE